MEAHHTLPVCRFPELIDDLENIMMLCHRCHKEVHINPFKNVQLMKAKTREMGIDLKERYDYE
ncbi:MAG: HNH endonuclease [Prevotella sp.]